MNNGKFRFEYDFVENSVSTCIGNALRQYSTGELGGCGEEKTMVLF